MPAAMSGAETRRASPLRRVTTDCPSRTHPDRLAPFAVWIIGGVERPVRVTSLGVAPPPYGIIDGRLHGQGLLRSTAAVRSGSNPVPSPSSPDCLWRVANVTQPVCLAHSSCQNTSETKPPLAGLIA